MDIGAASEKAMGMSDAVWARHTNPWSVWTRIASGPAWFLALWSYTWIGWRAAIPIALMAAWTWINPRAFPPPKHFEAWASKAVLGERVWLEQKEHPIPVGFSRAASISIVISLMSLAVAAYGFWRRDFWAAFMGWHAAMLSKVWFVDRMAFLWSLTSDQAGRMRAWSIS